MGMAPAEDAETQPQAPGQQRRLRHKGETWTFSDWKPKGRKPHRIRAIHAESIERLERAASDSQLFFDSVNSRNLFSSPLVSDHPVAASKKGWQPRDSAKLYNVAGWGSPYFHVDRAGQVCVNPCGEADDHEVSIPELVSKLQEQGLHTPILLRFPDILCHRLQQQQACFDAAVARYNYQGSYRGVFPVKCNHDKDLLSNVVSFGQKMGFGLEAGSKPELLMALALLAKHPGSNLICNGYKDAEYMELALRSRQLGINAMIVLEQFSELNTLLMVSKRLGIRPVIGVRAKLHTRNNVGHWGSTSGDRAKFGLKARMVVAVVEALAEQDMLDCFQLLHFHIGSQVTNIRIIKEAMREASFLYAELVTLGAAMRYIDVGGGLGIDYDGTSMDTVTSVSYTLQNYANDVVAGLQEVCTLRNIAAPIIISESGRSLGSHSAVMVFDVLSTPEEIGDEGTTGSLPTPGHTGGRSNKGAFLLSTFREVYEAISPSSDKLREAYADAAFVKEEALSAFTLGMLSLEERAEVDIHFDAICDRIMDVGRVHAVTLPEELQPSTRPHSAMYHINLSVFRSAPDAWAIEQLFPIMPIHRLDEEPTVNATLADITCDSDGKIDKFINPEGGEPAPVLRLHALREKQPYYLAMFLTGVYQEVLGSVHNMLGSTNCVVVRSGTRPAADSDSIPNGTDLPHANGHANGRSRAAANGTSRANSASHQHPKIDISGPGWYVEHVNPGETMQQVLSRSQHEGPEMYRTVRSSVMHAVMSGSLPGEEGEKLLQGYKRFLQSYTYLN
ncbi:hypothetical protein WJX74_007147 [Apatococcus lobatus]|uniref:Arginine decarboxylase n=1 Tax=Apatococcus lobatus TaxID=904363 RepID=A0AAW1SB07_9CHLO